MIFIPCKVGIFLEVFCFVTIYVFYFIIAELCTCRHLYLAVYCYTVAQILMQLVVHLLSCAEAVPYISFCRITMVADCSVLFVGYHRVSGCNFTLFPLFVSIAWQGYGPTFRNTNTETTVAGDILIIAFCIDNYRARCKFSTCCHFVCLSHTLNCVTRCYHCHQCQYGNDALSCSKISLHKLVNKCFS